MNQAIEWLSANWQWLLAFGVLPTIAVVRKAAPDVWAWLPDRLQWLPNALGAGLGAAVTASERGLSLAEAAQLFWLAFASFEATVHLTPRLLRGAKTMRGAAAAVVAGSLFLLLGGCSGGLEQARFQGVTVRLLKAAPRDAELCASLDNQHRWFGGAAKAAAFGAGASGVSTWPVEGKNAETALAVTAGGLALGAVGFEWMAQNAAEQYVEEGCAQ